MTKKAWKCLFDTKQLSSYSILEEFAKQYAKLIFPFDPASKDHHETTYETINQYLEALCDLLNDQWNHLNFLSSKKEALDTKIQLLTHLLYGIVNNSRFSPKKAFDVAVELMDLLESRDDSDFIIRIKKYLHGFFCVNFPLDNGLNIADEIQDIIIISCISNEQRDQYDIQKFTTPDFFSSSLSSRVLKLKKTLYDKNKAIKTYLKKDCYIVLPFYNDFDKASIKIDSDIWPSPEHFYQCQKFKHLSNFLEIKKIFFSLKPIEINLFLKNHSFEEENKVTANWYPAIILMNHIDSKFFNDSLKGDLGKGLKALANSLKAKFEHTNKQSYLMEIKDETIKDLILQHKDFLDDLENTFLYPMLKSLKDYLKKGLTL
jgi:predicted NAD-dependent protein-ADP-ribosyltransferase YbiA (DUF1768 family)